MNLNKAKIFGETGAIILLSFILLQILMSILYQTKFLLLSRIGAYIWIFIFRDTLFYNFLSFLVPIIGLTLIGIGIIFISKYFKNKKILVLFFILAGIFILETIITMTAQAISISLTKPVQGTIFYRIINWINSLYITGTFFPFVLRISIIFPVLEAIFTLWLLVYIGRVVNKKSFYFAGIFYFVGVGLMPIFIFSINTFRLYWFTVNNHCNIFSLISEIILAVSYLFLLRGFLKLKNNQLQTLET